MSAANIVGIIGYLGKFYTRFTIKETDKQQVEASSDYRTEMALLDHQKKEFQDLSMSRISDSSPQKEGGEQEEDKQEGNNAGDRQITNEDHSAIIAGTEKTMHRIDQKAAKLYEEGTMKKIGHSLLLFNSVFNIAPTVFFLYAIFRLICYLVIVDLKDTGV